jgi:hypothetical protein
MKSGWKTTEFWISCGTSALALAALVWGLSPAEHAEMADRLQATILALGAVSGNAMVLWKYIEARAGLKAAEMMVSGLGAEPLAPDEKIVEIDE